MIRETVDGIIEETGKKLSIEEVAISLLTTRKTLSAIINGKQAVTQRYVEFLLLVSKCF